MIFSIERSSWFGVEDKKETPCEGVTRNEQFGRWEIEIPTLDSLIALSKVVGEPLIIDVSSGKTETDPPTIEIYDAYRE